jgi:hypothetical protein
MQYLSHVCITNRKQMAKTIKLHKSKPLPTYKYRLQELVDGLPKSTTMQSLQELLKRHRITANQFWRDRTARYTSDFNIPVDRMVVYSQLFDTPIEQLMNHTIKVKPLIQSRIKTPLR